MVPHKAQQVLVLKEFRYNCMIFHGNELMQFIYSLVFYLITPFLLLRLWWKGRTSHAYRRRILERFYLGQRHTKPVDVWVHAVSLGEVIAVTPLVDAMLAKGWSILITTMTPTGAEQVKLRFGDKLAHQYVPYDLPGVLKRFFRRIKPRVGLIMETELWPNLIHQAHRAKVPLLLLNARLSAKSLHSYLKFKWFFKPILNQFTGILTQSEDDAQRFIRLGADSALVHDLGNMKFDLQTNFVDASAFNALKKQWGADRIVLIAASTHDDEESQILARLKHLQKAIPKLILLIAPRHPERFQTVYQLSIKAGFVTGLRSVLDTVSPTTEVLVLDSMGELLGFYQVSDYAFVGGSLVPVGGHNVLEPIAMKVPVFSGTQVHNFKTICKDLQEAHAIELVDDADSLADRLIRLHEDVQLRQQMVMNASVVLEKNKGALAKHLGWVEKCMLRSRCER